MGTVGSIREQRQELHDQLTEARARSDELFELLRPEALVDRPIPERHRVVFYLGHLEAFDWNLVARATFGIEPFSPKLDQLFAQRGFIAQKRFDRPNAFSGAFRE